MEIDRETIDGVGPNGVDVREYSYDGDKLPSVTTVLKTRDDDKGNLHAWEDRNDGVDDAADHSHLFWYSRHVGTLSHWFALKELDDTLEWTKDEASSVVALRNTQSINSDDEYQFYEERLGKDIAIDGSQMSEIHSDGPREILYSILRGDKNKGGGTVASMGEFYDKHPPYRTHSYYADALVERAKTDIAFFRDAQLRLWEKLGINTDSAIAVEQYLFNNEHGYAGQVDLVYEDPNDCVVVADLKSSSGCYEKHQLQGAAYGKAIELSDNVAVDSVDRLEVHRTHPRSGQMAVHTHSDADGKQQIHTTKYWNESYDDLWERFRQLAEDFEYDTNET
jgi:hypothetical protein